MRADYNLIAQDHPEGYDSYSHPLDAYEDLYSDDLHFLYELIQNAQEAVSSHPDKQDKRRMLCLVLRDHELLT